MDLKLSKNVSKGYYKRTFRFHADLYICACIKAFVGKFVANYKKKIIIKYKILHVYKHRQIVYMKKKKRKRIKFFLLTSIISNNKLINF